MSENKTNSNNVLRLTDITMQFGGVVAVNNFNMEEYEGEIVADCDEGELAWIEKADLHALPMWEGDKIFLSLLDERRPFFSLKLVYEKETLIEARLDGRRIR